MWRGLIWTRVGGCEYAPHSVLHLCRTLWKVRVLSWNKAFDNALSESTTRRNSFTSCTRRTPCPRRWRKVQIPLRIPNLGVEARIFDGFWASLDTSRECAVQKPKCFTSVETVHCFPNRSKEFKTFVKSVVVFFLCILQEVKERVCGAGTSSSSGCGCGFSAPSSASFPRC